ncbi:MAG: hypothetical protein ETSY1_34510 [Candidatus Entotheonella factor]|uniref:Uncharacterized protein n=1 Tax=Entotheonella factor TaxID=1429438 RepID=W4L9Y7_ENTF1|nr:hypothetical protein [Candidatus Entotheonella palauensis]ETW94515.1 MAG: hypothetical protein ETSY1_34510 [Candidatus Entotheonella factor]
MAIIIIWLWLVIIGGRMIFRFALREQQAIIKRILLQLPISIPKTERIQAVILLRSVARQGVKQWFPNRSLALATQQRLLLIDMRFNGYQIQSVWQLPYHQIASIDLPEENRFAIAGLPARMTIAVHSNQKLVFEASRFELSGFAEALEQLRAQPHVEGVPSSPLGLGRIFPDAAAPTMPPDHKRPLRAALLSVLYPGIGQLYNGELWRGGLFLILYTLTLGMAWQLFMNWYLQYTEVPFTFILFLTSGVLLIWILAIFDAYTDEPQQSEA